MDRTRVYVAAVVIAALGGGLNCTPVKGPLITPLHEADLSSTQQVQRGRALEARRAMFNALLTRLTEAMEDGGPAAAIGVCADEAPQIAARVSAEHHLRIGRTSHRLRNPRNAPPAWAEQYVAARLGESAYVAGTAGELRCLFPIQLGEGCLTCHGPADKIPADVRAALRDRYPEDRATGFTVGDLRGWFWVEVPPPT